MGGKSEGEHTTTSTQETGPPEWATPYLQSGAAEAQRLSESGRSFFPDRTYVPMSPMTREGLTGMATTAQGGSPLGQAGYDTATATARGDFLRPAALEQASRAAIDRVLPSVTSNYIAANRTGSGMHANAVADATSRAVAEQYNTERGRQLQAMGMTPMLEAARYDPYGRLLQAGAGMEAYDARELADRMARFEFAQEEPRRRNQEYIATLSGVAPYWGGFSTGTQTQPLYQPSPLSQIAGLGMAGLGMASGLGWAPFASQAATTMMG